MASPIAFFVFPRFQLLDLSGPAAVFEVAGQLSGRAYDQCVISEHGGAVESSCGIVVPTEVADRLRHGTLLVVGGDGARAAADAEPLLECVRLAANDAVRVASVCSGAFVLAAAGLLDRRRVTTHWGAAAALQKRFANVEVEPDRIYVRDGRFWTSAGVTAGIDLALAMVADDLGDEVAKRTAQELVVPYRRSGGQSQFSSLEDVASRPGRIPKIIALARKDLRQPLTVERLAALAGMSPRQFSRVFVVETGTTPAKAIERLRVDNARAAVEDGQEPLEAIARASGFGDAEHMRRAFLRTLGQPPQALRRRSAYPCGGTLRPR